MHIEFGDIITISFVERCDGEVLALANFSNRIPLTQ